MAHSQDSPFSHNLWSDPWIPLQRLDGTQERLSIAGVLKNASAFRAITPLSPLEVVGIHRLLAAILQAAIQPQSFQDLHDLLEAGTFPKEAIERFGTEFAERFDMFSYDHPFLQTNDLPLLKNKESDPKAVSSLFFEIPSATNIVHFLHMYDSDQYICPACLGGGLTLIPAFASAGGKGYKTSINGVPPIYVLPDAPNLFTSLVYSLILPDFQPGARSDGPDLAWWSHPPSVGKSTEVNEVGYLHSLTFPARRVRLHPFHGERACTRCGEFAAWGVSDMVYEMGESRPKDSPFWQDPFAAYTTKGESQPIPLRPSEGKATWREFGSLFLKRPDGSEGTRSRLTKRPRIIDQLDALETDAPISFRCIGIRTDMKAKVFEWIDTGFDLPLALLHSTTAGLDVDDALDFANDAAKILSGVVQELLNRSRNGNRYVHVKNSLREQFWERLASPFRAFLIQLATKPEDEALPPARKAALLDWYGLVTRIGIECIQNVLEQMGDDGHMLRLRYQALEGARRRLYGQLKKEKINHE